MTPATVNFPGQVFEERKTSCSGSALSDVDENICSGETRKNFHSASINTVLPDCMYPIRAVTYRENKVPRGYV